MGCVGHEKYIYFLRGNDGNMRTGMQSHGIKKQVMQIGPADAQCLNCDTLGTTVRMNMIQNHYPLDTKNVYAILLNPKRKSLILAVTGHCRSGKTVRG